MIARPLHMVLALMLASAAFPAAAQRTDVLTGEPVRPPSAHPRPEPQIFNAPHAPRQVVGRGDNPPMEIYVAPQIGGSTGYPGTNGMAGSPSSRATSRPLSHYPSRFPQDRRY